jgi:hypothetical protein
MKSQPMAHGSLKRINGDDMELLKLHEPVVKTFPSIFNSISKESNQVMVIQRYCKECGVRYPCDAVREEQK